MNESFKVLFIDATDPTNCRHRPSTTCNLVMTSTGEFCEVQGTGEEATFSELQLQAMLALGKKGINELLALQNSVIALED